jgi:hypothetical protein
VYDRLSRRLVPEASSLIEMQLEKESQAECELTYRSFTTNCIELRGIKLSVFPNADRATL